MSETRFRSGMLVFPNMTQLDLTGPYEVLARLPGAETCCCGRTSPLCARSTGSRSYR
jgi:cyclohexyl-isocyanide hydratase